MLISSPSTTDRGQGLNHCICDVSHVLSALGSVLHPTPTDPPPSSTNDTTVSDIESTTHTTLASAINAYDAEIIPRGAEEVKCSLENGYMLHDWEKVLKSPVFTRGFKAMTGHDGQEKAEEKVSEKAEVTEHAEVQMEREKAEVGGAERTEIAAH